MGMQTATAAEKLSAVEELTTLPLRGENPYLREWQKNGGSVFGYTCSNVPEEILNAAGAPAKILPIRLGAQGCTAWSILPV